MNVIAFQSGSALEVPIAKSTLSHHFKVFREAGIINTRIEGTQRFISLRRDDLDARFPGFTVDFAGI
ncbi:transcriptional regulator [Effusibacillus lacus]|uniref:Transcriptional regulator n=1 Tax=Effusibacillus lacus TaxID=1348429 RepID=A0A292YLI3_9BACL|nr:transcriptional regulator [Effusibacillus lacus]